MHATDLIASQLLRQARSKPVTEPVERTVKAVCDGREVKSWVARTFENRNGVKKPVTAMHFEIFVDISYGKKPFWKKVGAVRYFKDTGESFAWIGATYWENAESMALNAHAFIRGDMDIQALLRRMKNDPEILDAMRSRI